MYAAARALLFALPPETAHDLTLAGLRVASQLRLLRAPAALPGTSVEVMGLTFPNRVGLAAGLDKDGVCLNAWGALGFGFVEVGTVTPRPQPGNPKPRLFRLPQAEAIINRMGFNNDGVDALAERLRHHRFPGRIGVNIGKNADTPLEQALSDYQTGMRAVYALADYIAVNISSPNTPGLRSLQGADHLSPLLDGLCAERQALREQHGRYVPLAVKLAPDLSEAEIEACAKTIAATDLDAVIATNTTLDRTAVNRLRYAEEAGGLSGAPLREKSTEFIRHLRSALPDRVSLIGVGGISSAEDAKERIGAGANLVQVYTGLIYRGPSLIRDLVGA